ncbi:MAG: IS630 family transposase [Planctomycetota bacterium]
MSFGRIYFDLARRFAQAGQLVFLDESSAKTNMTRLYGRAPRGQRCRFARAHGHWKTTTMLSAIRSQGVIESASVVFEGATTAEVFVGYVQQMLAPSLRGGDIVVMDNLAAHKVTGVVEAIEAVGATVWYLPPYSPDLNPIEKMWSKVKSHLRQAAAKTIDGLNDAIGDALRSVGPEECRNYFRSCGYCD